MNAAWICLILAGLFEIGWALGLKLAQTPGKLLWGIPIAVVFMAASGVFLFLAQTKIPLGTSYAVWTGIGAAGTFLASVAFYGEHAGPIRLLGVALVIVGIALLHQGGR